MILPYLLGFGSLAFAAALVVHLVRAAPRA
jgi:hypothetical protein